MIFLLVCYTCFSVWFHYKKARISIVYFTSLSALLFFLISLFFSHKKFCYLGKIYEEEMVYFMLKLFLFNIIHLLLLLYVPYSKDYKLSLSFDKKNMKRCIVLGFVLMVCIFFVFFVNWELFPQALSRSIPSYIFRRNVFTGLGARFYNFIIFSYLPMVIFLTQKSLIIILCIILCLISGGKSFFCFFSLCLFIKKFFQKKFKFLMFFPIFAVFLLSLVNVFQCGRSAKKFEFSFVVNRVFVAPCFIAIKSQGTDRLNENAFVRGKRVFNSDFCCAVVGNLSNTKIWPAYFVLIFIINWFYEKNKTKELRYWCFIFSSQFFVFYLTSFRCIFTSYGLGFSVLWFALLVLMGRKKEISC